MNLGDRIDIAVVDTNKDRQDTRRIFRMFAE